MNKKLATLLFAVGLGASTSVLAWQDVDACVRGCGQVLTRCLEFSTNAAESAQCLQEFNECRDWCGF
ncbi:hypothetical protein NM04_21085 [Massilia aurea]|uniref:Uncharacterized protein n=1 Tax=Massilia aurea TaxID=373040 RepID=A0A422QFP8_9BURK|nr:hypothetical protein [Massilia aurea]RNF28833.1 hypothetical protein NM04_21085 [Massilia aurea]